MHIFDLFESAPEDAPGRHTEKDDNTALTLSDLRKTRLSLEQLNRLRIMNDVRSLEHEKKLEKIHKQYGAADAGGADAGGMGAAPAGAPAAV
jgi:hypothetical protein